MARDQIYLTACGMAVFGNRFVQRLGYALAIADDENALRLMTSFYDVVAPYGPGSEPYDRIERAMLPQPEVSDSTFGEFQEAMK